ncbi:hypothetical protein AVEN_115351-1 [Araneus ventricosus]|uniref:Secreted protein n=1 Tax=Araneus ventricosus TaxID=182803 RepID=A0A4Y1ZYE4_ARAVE|nr:hypothetical protein AVEN_115351-1 [Araneus ventricosus]
MVVGRKLGGCWWWRSGGNWWWLLLLVVVERKLAVAELVVHPPPGASELPLSIYCPVSKATRGILKMDSVILNHCQMARTKDDLISHQ